MKHPERLVKERKVVNPKPRGTGRPVDSVVRLSDAVQMPLFDSNTIARG